MSQQLTIARPYAKAVFSDALDGNLLSPWSDALTALALIVDNSKIQQRIINPTLTARQHKELLLQVIQTALPKVVSTLGTRLENFINLVVRKKRLLILPDIALLYQQLLNEQRGIIEAQVVSAYALSEDHRAGIKTALEAKFNAQVALNFTKDESLIGGAIIRTAKWVMDGSVKGKLAKLAEDLNNL